MAKQFLAQVVAQAGAKGLTSDEHFTVDGTLLEAWASVKSFQPKEGKKASSPDDPGNPTVNLRGEKRSNETHASKTDPQAKLARKGAGKEANLSYSGNLLVENRNGLIVDAESVRGQRHGGGRCRVDYAGGPSGNGGGDKGFDTFGSVAECRNLQVTPHVAQNHARPGGSAIDARTTRHPGYKFSQRKRKRIEECFGWLKTIALLRKVRHRSLQSGLDIYLHLRRHGLQSSAHAKPGGRSSGRVTPGRHVSGWAWIRPRGPDKSEINSIEINPR